MKKFSGLLHRTKSNDSAGIMNVDSPEANAARGIRLFCESGSPNNAVGLDQPDAHAESTDDDKGEEVLHLPVIVEAAESSPNAAASAAYTIRKFLSKDNYNRPHVQYNAIMLIRILSDNPGPTFTRSMDPKFVATVKQLLKDGRDPSVQQILRETLDALEVNKATDEGLMPLLGMWRQAKGHGARLTPSSPYGTGYVGGTIPGGAPLQQQPNQRAFARHQLPAPHELASRVEESKNTAKILMQLVQSTPIDELMSNELIKEFAERCQSAQRSMQEYINCDSPPADDDTMQTLIETNEQLSLSMSRYQRALLSARRALGTRSNNGSPNPEAQSSSSPPKQSSVFSPLDASQPVQRNGSQVSDLSPVSPQSSAGSMYYATPRPPPSMTSRLQDRSPPLPSAPPAAPMPRPAEPAHDPFADPDEVEDYRSHPMEPAHYGRSPPRPSRKEVGSGVVTTASPQRPGPTTYYDGQVTQSYVGRQASAANGLTMHGAGLDDVAEMDGDSREGRGGTEMGMDRRQSVAYRY